VDDQQAERRELYNGFGDGMALAFQIALTPAIFAGLGFWLDHAIHKTPLFTIVLFLLAVVGLFISQWAQYEHRMQREESTAAWARSTRAVTTTASTRSASS
jgi:F0F1-type ATP synthase assembly protein I